MSYMETYREWCTNPYFSEETRAELEAIKDNEAEIEDRFYRQLEFGTGRFPVPCSGVYTILISFAISLMISGWMDCFFSSSM